MFKIALLSLTLLLTAVACFDPLMTLDEVNQELSTTHKGQKWEDLSGECTHDHGHDHKSHSHEGHVHASQLLVDSVNELLRTGHAWAPDNQSVLKMVKNP
jgi:hypothetical protein